MERIDPCILAESYVVSGWVEKRLGTVELVKVTWTRSMTYFAPWSRAPFKGVITGVALSVEAEHLKLKDSQCL